MAAAAVELDHVQQPELERAAAPFQAERSAGRCAAPGRIVDQKIVAVQSLAAFDPAIGQVGEQGLVEGARVRAAVGRAGGPADDVVLDVVGERGEHALDVVLRFEAEVAVDVVVHLVAGQGHRELLGGLWRGEMVQL